MNESLERRPVRRIVVALDNSPPSQAALRAAARLALLLGAELHAHFVEDRNLKRLASLPFASEVRTADAAISQLDKPRLLRNLQMAATRAAGDLRTEAERRALVYSFSVSQGAVTDKR